MSESFGLDLEPLRSLIEKNKHLIADTRQEELCGLTVDKKMKLQEYQLQYHDLKNAQRADKFKLLMFQMFERCNWDLNSLINSSEPLGGPTEADVQGVVHTLQALKEKFETSRDTIEEHADEIELLQAEFKELSDPLEQEVKELEEKRDELCEKYNISPATLNDGLQQQTEAMMEEARVAAAEQRRAEETLYALEASVSDLRQLTANDQAVQRMHMEQKSKGGSRIIRWSNNYIDVLQALSGIENVGFDGEGWTVVIRGDTNNDLDLVLEVKVLMSWDGYGEPRLTGVKVSNKDIDVSDVVEMAITMNSVKYLLPALQSVWLKHYPLISEIHTLRQKYAIDWVESQRHLHVMCGKASSIMCLLKVDQGYPKDGCVTLEAVKGDNSIDMSSLQPHDGESRTLTEWLEFLHRTLT